MRLSARGVVFGRENGVGLGVWIGSAGEQAMTGRLCVGFAG